MVRWPHSTPPQFSDMNVLVSDCLASGERLPASSTPRGKKASRLDFSIQGGQQVGGITHQQVGRKLDPILMKTLLQPADKQPPARLRKKSELVLIATYWQGG